jgi:hypothetical protein
MYGRDCLLSIEFDVFSWAMVDWEVTSHENLILARMRQLDQRNVHKAQAAANLRNSRKANKPYFDQNKRLRPDSQHLRVRDLVLVIIEHFSRAVKLSDRWRGPYQIRVVAENSTLYELEELNGSW